jgi:hypothetical protein
MPTALRVGPYRFHFYVADGNEPPHMHVARDNKELKVWLRSVSMARNNGYRKAEAKKIVALTRKHRGVLLKAWYDQFPDQ